MPTVHDLVTYADLWAAPNPYRPSAEELVYICEAAGCQQVPTLAEARKSLTELSNGVYIGSSVKHWCGIYTASLCRDLGLNVRWDLVKGRLAGAVTLAWGNVDVRPGDIAAIQKNQHHFLVTEVDRDANALVVSEGNTFNQQIKSGTRRPLRDVAWYYRIAGLT